MDTPGVMLPNVPDEQTGMRLALTGDGHNSAAATARNLFTGFHTTPYTQAPCLHLIMVEVWRPSSK